MSVVPGTLETDQQPPMTVPLRHFVVGFGFLLLGMIVGLVLAVGLASGLSSLAHVHLLLAGWVCLTIMGAMTQFVPVWSGVSLYSRRLASIQLWPVVVGLLGFAMSLLAGSLSWLLVFAALMLVGFWVFVYNIGRTLLKVGFPDVTERHFGIALGFFVLLTTLGFLLAIDFIHPIFGSSPLTRSHVVAAHATLAVFGAVLTTIIGALYQLGTMFTQTTLRGIDTDLQRIEEVAYPSGVVLLAGGRLFGSGTLGRVGGILIAGSLLGFSLILARRLYETRVEWTPMLSRYVVVALSLSLWSGFAAVAWVREPLAMGALFGAPGTIHLLVFGVIGFVVLGTLYHIVPFIIWVHRYSDRLGLEEVPMIDDLYDHRLAAADFGFLLGGLILLVVTDLADLSEDATGMAGVMALVGAILFTTNMVMTVRDHSPHSLGSVLFGAIGTNRNDAAIDGDVENVGP